MNSSRGSKDILVDVISSRNIKLPHQKYSKSFALEIIDLLQRQEQ